jgi:hypothetical protein
MIAQLTRRSSRSLASETLGGKKKAGCFKLAISTAPKQVNVSKLFGYRPNAKKRERLAKSYCPWQQNSSSRHLIEEVIGKVEGTLVLKNGSFGPGFVVLPPPHDASSEIAGTNWSSRPQIQKNVIPIDGDPEA